MNIRTPAILSGRRGKIHFGLTRFCTSDSNFIVSILRKCVCLKPWFCETLKHSMAISFHSASSQLVSIRPHADEAVKILSDAKHHFVWKPVCRPCALAQLVLTMSALEWFEYAGNEMPLCGYRPDLCLAQLILITSVA